MKKIYSLLAAAVVAATMNAQVTVFNATFDDVTGTGGNTGGFNGSVANTGLTEYTTGGSWTLDRAFKADKCLKMGASSNKGSLTTPGISLTGSGTLTFRAAAWDGNNEKLTLLVSATGATLDKSEVTIAKGAFNTFTVAITNVTGSVKIKFESKEASANRFFIDDIKVVQPTMAVVDAVKGSVNLVKNTVVSNELIFGAAAKVSVYNAAGQVVKTAEVAENTRLDVSALPKGTYIVTGLVNGQAVSQKIIKN